MPLTVKLMQEDSAVMGSAKDRFEKYVSVMSESLVPRWLAVEVIGFDKEEDNEKNKEKE